jgi:hypothetical protein
MILMRSGGDSYLPLRWTLPLLLLPEKLPTSQLKSWVMMREMQRHLELMQE